MKKVGVYVDVSNLYYCINKRFMGAKLNYQKYMDFIKDYGDVVMAIAYGAQLNNEARNFIHCIQKAGYIPKWKTPKIYHNETITLTEIRRKADWDVGITMDIVQDILDSKIERIILGTADGDLTPLVKWSIKRGVDVIIVACGISKDLKQAVGHDHFIEIPESLLEGKKDENL